MTEKIIIKNAEQINGIRKSSKLAAKCLDWIENQVQPGISTGELNRRLEGFIRDHGAIPACLGYEGFPAATCISLNEVVCHGIPSDNVILKKGDILNIDVTTILDGYYGDTGRMYTVPPISKEAQHIVDVAKQCLEIGIKQVKPGNYFGNIGYKIALYAHSQGCRVVIKFVGHGVGNFFHEAPQIPHAAPKDSGEIMEVGMTFTVEPMLNQKSPDVVIDEKDGWTVRTADGKLSAQWEQTLLVVNGGCEILTL